MTGLMSLSTKRLVLAGVVGLVLIASYAVRVRSGMSDFAVNYRAGQRLEAGETLYQPADGHYMFKYFPAAALVYLPLGHLSFESAKVVWFGISLLALAYSFVLVGQLVPLPHRRYLLIVPALVLAKYFLHELRLGQINIVVMAVMLLTARALTRNVDARHSVTAGVLAGLATGLKPYAAVFFPYFLIRRQWIAAAAGVAALAISLLIPVVFYGVHGNVQVLREWAVTLSQSTPALLTTNDNVSVLAFFSKWLGGPERAYAPSLAVLGLLALATLAVILRGEKKPNRSVLECAMLLTLIPLISPMGWDYTFLVSLLAVALIVNAFDAFPGPARIVLAVNFGVIGLTVFDLMGRQAYMSYMQWSVTTVNFLIVVAALVYLRFRAVL